MARMRTSAGLPYDERPQEIDGVAVIERQRALTPHPHPSKKGQLVESRGITQVLLADGREIFECDTCLRTKDKAQSIKSHLPTHNPAQHDPIYAVDTIRHVLRLCVAERRVSIRDYCVRVANRLNTEGKVTPVKSDTWTPDAVSRMYTRYHARYPVRVRATTRKSTVKSPIQWNTDDGGADKLSPRSRISELFNEAAEQVAIARSAIRVVETTLGDIMRAVDRIPDAQKIDPVILQKAKKYDEFMRQFSVD